MFSDERKRQFGFQEEKHPTLLRLKLLLSIVSVKKYKSATVPIGRPVSLPVAGVGAGRLGSRALHGHYPSKFTKAPSSGRKLACFTRRDKFSHAFADMRIFNAL